MMSMLLLLDNHMALTEDSFRGGDFVTHMEVGFRYPQQTIKKQVPAAIRSPSRTGCFSHASTSTSA